MPSQPGRAPCAAINFSTTVRRCLYELTHRLLHLCCNFSAGWPHVLQLCCNVAVNDARLVRTALPTVGSRNRDLLLFQWPASREHTVILGLKEITQRCTVERRGTIGVEVLARVVERALYSWPSSVREPHGRCQGDRGCIHRPTPAARGARAAAHLLTSHPPCLSRCRASIGSCCLIGSDFRKMWCWPLDAPRDAPAPAQPAWPRPMRHQGSWCSRGSSD